MHTKRTPRRHVWIRYSVLLNANIQRSHCVGVLASAWSNTFLSWPTCTPPLSCVLPVYTPCRLSILPLEKCVHLHDVALVVHTSEYFAHLKAPRISLLCSFFGIYKKWGHTGKSMLQLLACGRFWGSEISLPPKSSSSEIELCIGAQEGRVLLMRESLATSYCIQAKGHSWQRLPHRPWRLAHRPIRVGCGGTFRHLMAGSMIGTPKWQPSLKTWVYGFWSWNTKVTKGIVESWTGWDMDRLESRSITCSNHAATRILEPRWNVMNNVQNIP